MNRCCCFSLETGALIIGVLEIIGGIIGAILSIVTLCVGNIFSQELKNPNSKFFPKSGYRENGLDMSARDAAGLASSLVTVISIIYLIIVCIHLLLSSLLIHGIRKKSNTLLTVWIIFKVVFLVILVIDFVISWFVLVTSLKVATSLFAIGITAFYIKVVHDFKNQGSPNPNMQLNAPPPAYGYMNTYKA